MKISTIARCVAVLGRLAHRSVSAVYSGTVVNPDNTPQPGVAVSLVSSGQSSLTDSAGNWSIEATTGLEERGTKSPRPITNHLQLEAGRLKLSIHGWTPLGSPRGSVPTPFAKAGRAAGPGHQVDTLIYTFRSQIILRDTVWDAGRTHILRIFDTTLDPFFPSYGWDCGQTAGGLAADSVSNLLYVCWPVVNIGKQAWMVRNMGSGTNGEFYTWAAAMKYPDSCNFSRDCGVPDSCKSPHSCSYSRSSPHVQGICPTSDYRIPTDSDWVELIDTVQHNLQVGFQNEAVALKQQYGWAGKPGDQVLGPNRVLVPWTAGTNLYGFGARPMDDPTYSPTNGHARWWSSTQFPQGSDCGVADMTQATYMGVRDDQKTQKYSVRCVKDLP